MELENLSRKEYLRKYLAIGKAPGEKKKKKRKLKGVSDRVKIIDDDVGDANLTNKVHEDPFQVDEDAPQIVAIIDERPPSMRIDEKTNNHMWQPIGSANSIDNAEQKQVVASFKIGKPENSRLIKADKSLLKKGKREVEKLLRITENDIGIKLEVESPTHQHVPDTITVDDNSPPRRSRKSDDSSPPRRRNKEEAHHKNERSRDSSPARRNRRAQDFSPARRHKSDGRSGNSKDFSPLRKGRSNGYSPSRKRNESPPPPKRNKHSDNSPPRRRNKDLSPPRTSRWGTFPSDSSPPRKGRVKEQEKNKTKNDSPRGHKLKPTEDSTPSHATVDVKPERTEDEPSGKMKKTLEGKKAGLQNAEQLVRENTQFRERENQHFSNLSKEVSGENAPTVLRDRKTGKVRNLQEEEESQRKKQEEEQKNKEKYERWGRGLAQVENRDKKIQDELHEMSKPLARYADDEDLEKYLKEQEREGDPMLAYIRSKKRKDAVKAGKSEKPEFEGIFMPNRYGVKPGHRWDGVDRSNGYEKRWFEVQNEKRATLEDSYRWSTEDM